AIFQPREARVQESYTEIPIGVTAEGTYHQFEAFLARVAALPRMVSVRTFTMTAVERPAASLRAEMTLATYVYRPASAPAAAVSGGAGLSPAAVPREAAARDGAPATSRRSSSIAVANGPALSGNAAAAESGGAGLAPRTDRITALDDRA